MAESFSPGVVGYSPLAGGLPTGKYRQGGIGQASGADGEPPVLDLQKNEVLDTLISISADLGVQPSDVAGAWVLSRGVVPIFGVRSRLQLDSNLEALKVVLGADHLRSLDQVSVTPAGYRTVSFLLSRRFC
jgi:aryl-alcohol dehydrogenase-like predicted oxidoreductase